MAKSKTIGKLKKEAWRLLSLVKRSIDWAYPDGTNICYTCGVRKPWKEMQAGHLLDGRSNSILFEEIGINPQCAGCNIFKSGNKEVYIPKFIDEYGRDLYEELIWKKHQIRKISRSEYEEMIAEYKRRLNEMA